MEIMQAERIEEIEDCARNEGVLFNGVMEGNGKYLLVFTDISTRSSFGIFLLDDLKSKVAELREKFRKAA